MTCQSPTPNWWSRYLAGEFKTPQELVAAAYSEIGGHLTPTQIFFEETPEEMNSTPGPDRLKAPAWFLNPASLRQQQRADWSFADRRLMAWAAIFQDMARKRSIPLYVHTCLRTEAEQNALVKAGNSKAKYPNSAHNIAEAVDIVHGVFQWNMEPEEWKFLNVLGNLALDRVNRQLAASNKLILEWGGNWSFYDPAHWEIKDYRQRVCKLPAVDPVRRTPTQVLQQAQQLLRNL